MLKRWPSTVLAVASLSTVSLFAASVPGRIAADSETEVYDVSNQTDQQAELHRSPARSR
jgi:hypothetical protein